MNFRVVQTGFHLRDAVFKKNKTTQNIVKGKWKIRGKKKKKKKKGGRQNRVTTL
jgi:hypothetical protein